jgi:hypothetical protein
MARLLACNHAVKTGEIVYDVHMSDVKTLTDLQRSERTSELEKAVQSTRQTSQRSIAVVHASQQQQCDDEPVINYALETDRRSLRS